MSPCRVTLSIPRTSLAQPISGSPACRGRRAGVSSLRLLATLRAITRLSRHTNIGLWIHGARLPAAGSVGPRRSSTVSGPNLTYRDLLQIIELIKSSSQFGEFHLKVGDIEVHLRRHEGTPR